MILHALYELYFRPDPNNHKTPLGWQKVKIPYVIVLDPSGSVVMIEDKRIDAKRIPEMLVPQDCGRSVNIKANFLWDKASYSLGVTTQRSSTDLHPVDSETMVKRHKSFCDMIEKSCEIIPNELGLIALSKFLKLPEKLDMLSEFPLWKEIAPLDKDPNISFRLNTENELICHRPQIVEKLQIIMVDSSSDEYKTQPSICLITGEPSLPEKLHQRTPIKGSKASAKIVSFNKESFNSFGKIQSFNAPVSKEAALAYTNALNELLKKSRQRVQIGDASTVFWAATPTEYESTIPDAFGDPPKDDPGRLTVAVKKLYDAIYSGKLGAIEGQIRYCILGLAPNGARISVRFWHQATLHELAEKIILHFEDLKIIHRSNEPEYPSIKQLLLACTAAHTARDDEKTISPDLGGNIIRSIMDGTVYPASLLNAAVSRFRHETEYDQGKGRRYLRAAIIKACINREIRRKKQGAVCQEREVAAVLDLENKNPAYRLGRLFAVLEKIQMEASSSRKLNTTIRDRYYGAASATPAIVFPSLLRLKTHHLNKLVPGRKIQMEKLIGEIIDGLEAKPLPNHLQLPEQGLFALGYYHQWQKLFIRS